ncbi:MAG: DNA pilot protein [Microviridae sp.]|nr:MAG: DNA pilot protein [Microviridae sp.]
MFGIDDAVGAGSLLSGAGQVLGGYLSYKGEKSANKKNIRMAQKQMDFQREMSNTAYQRSAADLEKAGLNRILALGGPESSPSGAMAVVQNPHKATGDAIRGASSALAMKAQIDNLRSSTNLNNTNAMKASAEATQSDMLNSVLQQLLPFVKDISGKIPGLINSATDQSTIDKVGKDWSRGVDVIRKKIDEKVESFGNSAKQIQQDAEDVVRSAKRKGRDTIKVILDTGDSYKRDVKKFLHDNVRSGEGR